MRSGSGDDVVQPGAGADRHVNPSGAGRRSRTSCRAVRGPDVVIDVYAADLGDGDDRYLTGARGCLAIDLGAGDDTGTGVDG